MMLMPLAAVVAILLGRQQQRLATVESEVADLRSAVTDMEAMLEHAPAGLAVLDCDLRYERLNRLLAEMNGLAIEEHIGKSIHDIVPDIAPAAEGPMREVVHTGQPLLGMTFEGTTAAHPTVRRAWRTDVHPRRDRDGNMLGVTLIVVEITEQQRLSNALHDSVRREQRRTSELERLMQAAPVALCIASDPDCRRVKANPVAERLLRLRRGESPSLSGPGEQAFTAYAGATQLEFDQLPLQRAAATGEEIHDEALTLHFADDDELHLVVNALPVRDEAGEIIGAVAGFVATPALTADVHVHHHADDACMNPQA
jgi:PAS domain S-box-containing protein